LKYRPPGRHCKHRPPFGASSSAARRSAAALRASLASVPFLVSTMEPLLLASSRRRHSPAAPGVVEADVTGSWPRLAGGPAWRAKRSLVISSPRAHPLGALASRRPLACAIDQQSHEYGMDRGLGGRGVAGTGRRMQPCSLAMAPRAISFKFISFAIYL